MADVDRNRPVRLKPDATDGCDSGSGIGMDEGLGIMNVSVFGLGYVGSVSAASFAADGHTVVGVDVNPDKVASLNAGRSPIVEKGLEELIRHGRGERHVARDDEHGGGHQRDRSVAAVRRHAEPEEREPGSLVPRARLRADRRGAEGQGHLPRRRRPQHRAARHDPRPGDSHPREGVRQEVRDGLRRHRQSGVPPRGDGDPRFPQSAAHARRPQLPVGRRADRGAVREGRRADDQHQHPHGGDDEVREQHVARAEGVLRERDRQPL